MLLQEGFEPTSVLAADGSGVWRERCTLRDLVSGNHFSGGLNDAFKKASYSIVLRRFIIQAAGSVHGIFFSFSTKP